MSYRLWFKYRKVIPCQVVIFCLLIIQGCTHKDASSVEALKTGVISTFDSLSVINIQIKKDINDPKGYLTRSKYLYRQGNKEKALNDVNRALKIDSTISEAYLMKADLLIEMRRYRDSKMTLERLLKIDKINTWGFLKLSKIYMALKNYDKAFEHINAALKIDPYHAEAYYFKGLVYKLLKDTANAISSFQTAVERKEHYQSYNQLGILYALKHDSIAIDYYNNAIRMDSNNIEAIYNKNLYLQSNNRVEEALMGYNYILKKDPKHINSLYNKGYIYLVYLPNYEQAIHFFSKAIEIDQYYSNAYYNIGYAFELSNNESKALEYYKKTLKIQPSHTLAAKGISRLKKE